MHGNGDDGDDILSLLSNAFEKCETSIRGTRYTFWITCRLWCPYIEYCGFAHRKYSFCFIDVDGKDELGIVYPIPIPKTKFEGILIMSEMTDRARTGHFGNYYFCFIYYQLIYICNLRCALLCGGRLLRFTRFIRTKLFVRVFIPLFFFFVFASP